jgi:hypothetical protein
MTNILSTIRGAQEALGQLSARLRELESEICSENAAYIYLSPEEPPKIVLGGTGLDVLGPLCVAQERTTGLMAFYGQQDALADAESLCLVGPVLLANFDDTGTPVSVTSAQFRAAQAAYEAGKTVLRFGPASIAALKLDVYEGI